nr:RDD family protein [Rathayibacter sp. VKM Ac-2804]
MSDDRDDAAFDSAGLVTGEAIALEIPVTSFVLRAAGAIIDLAAEVLLAFGLFYLVAVLAGDGGLDPAATAAVAIAALVVSIVLVPVAVETATRGRSLGKLAVGARVVRDDGGSIGFRHALVRGLTGVLEIVMTAGGLAAVVGLLSSRSRRLGDVLAGTHSRLERVPAAPPLVVEVPAPLAGWAATADAARLPDALARRLAQFLRQRSGMTEPSRSQLAAALARRRPRRSSRRCRPPPPRTSCSPSRHSAGGARSARCSSSTGTSPGSRRCSRTRREASPCARRRGGLSPLGPLRTAAARGSGPSPSPGAPAAAGRARRTGRSRADRAAD